MWALLGDLWFELLLAPEMADLAIRHEYAEHPVIEGKPHVQWVGDALRERNWGIRLHAVFCDPDSVMADIRAVAAEHKALPLSLGTGEYLGRYTINEIREQTLVTDQYGGTISQTAELRLREWVGTDVQETGEAVVADDDPVPDAILWDETADVDAALEVDTEDLVSQTTLLLARAAELGALGLDVLADVVDAAYGLAGAIGLDVAGLAALAQTAAGVVSDVATIAEVVADTLAALPEIPVVGAAMAVAQAAGADVLVAGVAALSLALDGDLTRVGELIADASVCAVIQALGGNLPVYETIRDTAEAYATGSDPLVGLRALLRVA